MSWLNDQFQNIKKKVVDTVAPIEQSVSSGLGSMYQAAKNNLSNDVQGVKSYLSSPAPQWAQNIPTFSDTIAKPLSNTPTAHFADNMSWNHPVQKFGAELAQGMVNTVPNIFKGYGNTVRSIDGMNVKSSKDWKNVGGNALNLGLDMAQIAPIGAFGKTMGVAKESLKTPVSEGLAGLGKAMWTGAKDTSKIMGRYGAGYALADSMKNDNSLKDTALNVGQGYLGGRVAGGVLGAGVAGVAPATKLAINEGKNIFGDMKKILPSARTYTVPAVTENVSRNLYDANAGMGRFDTTGKKVGGFNLLHKQGPVSYPEQKVVEPFQPKSGLFQYLQKPQAGMSIRDISFEKAGVNPWDSSSIRDLKLEHFNRTGKVLDLNAPITPLDNQSGRIPSEVNPQTMMEKPNQVTTPKEGQPLSQSPSLSVNPSMGQKRIVETSVVPSYPENVANSRKNVQQRGFVTSVQETPAITPPTKETVSGGYVPKPNTQLMGEAQALLSDSASIDFKNTKNLDQKVAATIQEAINQDKAGNHEAAANLFNNLATHATELGRGVQALSLLQNMSPESVALSVAGKINKYNEKAVNQIPTLSGEQQKMISDTVTAIRGMVDGREKNIAINEFNNTLSNFFPSSWADKAITVWKAGLLTSLRTHERNLLGNTIQAGAEIAKDPIASIADWAMSQRTGKRSMTSTLRGIGEFGSQKTRQQVTDLVTKGYDPNGDIAKFDIQKNITWEDTPTQNFLKWYTDKIFRPLGAEDKPFWNASFQRSLYDQAGAEAINAGKKGDIGFIDSLVKNPNDSMLINATDDANYATFKDKNVLGSTARAMKKAMASGDGWLGEVGKIAGEVLAPFTGVPSSIVTKTMAYSPLGLMKGIYSTGKVLVQNVPELQRQAAQEIGRGVVGTALWGLGSYLMSQGLMTGQPKDAKEADLWAAEGKQANSVLIGGKWRSVNSIGPQNLVILAGAKYNEMMNDPNGSPYAYGSALVKDQLNQTFLQGVQGPLNAINDPNRYAQSYVGNQIASTVPNIIKDTSKFFDPNQRENNSIIDYTTNSIPGLRNLNLPKRDVLGNILPQEPTGAGAFFDLFNSKTPVSNPVVDELSRLNSVDVNATPSKLQKSQTVFGQKLKLTPEELNNLEAQSGGVLRPALENLVTSDGYKMLSDEEKQNMIQKTVQSVRSQVKNGVALGDTGAITSFPSFDSNSVDAKNKLAMEKIAFENSPDNFRDLGNIVLRKNPDGTSRPQRKAEYNLETANYEMTAAKDGDNFEEWKLSAEKKAASIQSLMADPSVDPNEKMKYQHDLTSLATQYAKYAKLGDFTGASKAKDKALYNERAQTEALIMKVKNGLSSSLASMKTGGITPTIKFNLQQGNRVQRRQKALIRL